MAILKPDKAATLGSVTVNEYLFTKHNPNRIIIPQCIMNCHTNNFTLHRSGITTTPGTTPAEQYTRATVNLRPVPKRKHQSPILKYRTCSTNAILSKQLFRPWRYIK